MHHLGIHIKDIAEGQDQNPSDIDGAWYVITPDLVAREYKACVYKDIKSAAKHYLALMEDPTYGIHVWMYPFNHAGRSMLLDQRVPIERMF